jgi:hypothetical protein
LIRAARISRQISAIAATLCAPPCVAVCPQPREISREASGRLHRSSASRDRALPPGSPHPSYRKRAEYPASKTSGTATIPSHWSLPTSARFADEHPIRSGAPGAPLTLTPRGLTAFLRRHPYRACRRQRSHDTRQQAPGIQQLSSRCDDVARCCRMPSRADCRSCPASAPGGGLRAQDTRTTPLDVQRAYVPGNTRFSHD